VIGRLYCTAKAMWKLGWFVRNFLYDPELLSTDEIDERALRGLTGVVKISHRVINGISLGNLDGFAPASQWEQMPLSCRSILPHPDLASVVPERDVVHQLANQVYSAAMVLVKTIGTVGIGEFLLRIAGPGVAHHNQDAAICILFQTAAYLFGWVVLAAVNYCIGQGLNLWA